MKTVEHRAHSVMPTSEPSTFSTSSGFTCVRGGTRRVLLPSVTCGRSSCVFTFGAGRSRARWMSMSSRFAPRAITSTGSRISAALSERVRPA